MLNQHAQNTQRIILKTFLSVFSCDLSNVDVLIWSNTLNILSNIESSNRQRQIESACYKAFLYCFKLVALVLFLLDILFSKLDAQIIAEKYFQFTAGVGGFHVSRWIWKPFMGEESNCNHEYCNAFNCFSIETEKDGLIVGHLPREISRVTKFFLDRGAKVTAIFRSDHYRKLPLFQGGLEVRCFIMVTLRATIRGKLLSMKKWSKNSIQGRRRRPSCAVFLSKPETLNIDKTTHLSKRKRRKKNVNKINNVVKYKDIIAMLKKFKWAYIIYIFMRIVHIILLSILVMFDIL